MVLRNWVLALSVATAGLTAHEVGAKSLTLAVGVGPKNSITLTMQGFADYMSEHTDLDIKVYPLSLLNLKETPLGLRDGLADIGFVLTPYYPAEYSEMNLAANLGMLSTAGVQVASPGAAIAGALSEYVLNCEECLAEFKAQKQVYLGSGIGSTYMMLCTTPVQSVEDIKGKKFRSGSDNFSRWAEHFGGIAVSLPGNDQYEAMSQGVIDCTMASATELTNYSLFDVTKSVTLGIPGGNFAGVATNNFNIDVWRGLEDDERKAALMASARSAADLTWRYYMDSERDLAAAPEKGITVLEPSAEVRAMSDEFVTADLKVIEEQFTSGYGLDNVDEKIAEFSRLVDKWKALTADIGGDHESLAQIYWDEIFSKVDPTTYAMN